MRTAGRDSPPVATSRSTGGSSALLDSSAGLRYNTPKKLSSFLLAKVLLGILRLKKSLQL